MRKRARVALLCAGLALCGMLSCTRESRIVPLESATTLLRTVELPAGVGGEVYDVELAADTAIVFTDLARRGLFVFNPESNAVRQIGTNGPGPGEYILPAEIDVSGRTIFVKELVQPVVKAFGLNGSYWGKVQPRGSMVEKFCAAGTDEIYVLSETGPAVSRISLSGEVRAASEATAPAAYRYVLTATHGGGVCRDAEGYVYYCFAAPYVIHKLTPALKETATFDATRLRHYHPYPRELLEPAVRGLSGKERRNAMKKATDVLALWADGAGRLYVKLSDPTRRFRSLVDVFSTDGTHLMTLAVQDKYFAGISSGNIVLVETAGEGATATKVKLWFLKLR